MARRRGDGAEIHERRHGRWNPPVREETGEEAATLPGCGAAPISVIPERRVRWTDNESPRRVTRRCPHACDWPRASTACRPTCSGGSTICSTRSGGPVNDVIDLGMGNPSDPPEDIVIEKLAEALHDPDNHGYSKSNGMLNLRREVASKYFRRYGVRLDPETEVMVCLGSKEGFSHMCLALMGPGDTAIIPAPYFPVHTYAVALAAGNVIALEVADSEKFLSNIAYTCQHLYPRPKLLIINYPHNPSTVTVEPEFFVEVVKLAKRYGFMVISDFAYADVAFDGYKPPSFLAAPGPSMSGWNSRR